MVDWRNSLDWPVDSQNREANFPRLDSLLGTQQSWTINAVWEGSKSMPSWPIVLATTAVHTLDITTCGC